MKKSLLILTAAGAIALAGCSKTEFVSAPHDAIGFRTSVATATKATSTTTATLASFNAYAINHATSAAYFEDVTFTKGDDNTFTSANEYIWPAGSLDFYAYAPVGSSQVVKTDCKTFTVTPSATASEQVDFIYANTNGKTKDANADGVAINFRHTESQIALKVKNSSASLKFEVAGWKVAYLSKSGKFTYADDNTDAASTQLAKTDWSDLGTAAVTNTYEQSLTSSVSVTASASTATAVGESFILIPQSQDAATGYAAATTNSAANGSYIAVKLIIRNAIDNSVIYSDGATTPGAAWAMWPVKFEWEPGKKYTYVVDLAGCGFKETNAEGGSGTDLDKVYESVPITFVRVTVDEFAAQDDIEVTMPAENTIPEDALPGVFSVSATKKVHFSQGNLTYDVNASTNKWKFYEHQYDCAANGDASSTLISLFTWGYGDWSTDPTTMDYLTSHTSDGEPFNPSEDWGSQIGDGKTWRTLTTAEWQYLFSNHTKKWASVNDVNGYVIAPDGFDGELADSYADDAALAAAGNLVFLPAAGDRNGSNVYYVGDFGRYWSSTARDEDDAYNVIFDSFNVSPGNFDRRNIGYSVRLITESK